MWPGGLVKMSEENREIEIIYKKEEDYEIFPVNGAHGGFTSRGDLLVNFFFEHEGIPEMEKLELDEEGNVVSSKFEGEFHVRNVKIGISLSSDQALSIANWIIDKVEDYQEEKEKENE